MQPKWVETWNKMPCGQCGAACWYCFGDISDVTGYEPDKLRCHACDNEWWITNEQDWRELNQDNDNEPHVETAKAVP